MKRNLWTLPNILSISRALLAIPFVAVMLSSLESKRTWGVVILFLGALTDKLDGVFARRFNQESEWGRILDPLADKVGVATVALVLMWLGDLPVWFVAILLVRDLLIFLGGIYLRYRTKTILPSNTAGKWSVGVFSITLLAALLGVSQPVLWVCIAASVAMSLVSMTLYIQRFLITLGGEHSA